MCLAVSPLLEIGGAAAGVRAIGVIAYLPLIASRWEMIGAALLVSVTVTIALTALTVSWLLRRSPAAEATP